MSNTKEVPLYSTLSHTDVRSVITGLMLAILLGALDQTIVSVALPMMSSDLQGVDLLAWVVSGYLIAVAVATPIYGKLGDLYGRRIMLSSAISVFLLASIACAMAPSMPFLVGSRIVQGLGGGGLISVAQAIVADVVAPRDRGRYQGYISGAFAVASVTGPLAGGFLTTYLSWRWVFWINLPLGLIALFISRRALKLLPTPNIKRPIDYPGAILLTIGLATLLIGVTRVGQGSAWLDAGNLKLFAATLAALAAFFWQEQHTAEPIVPLNLFRSPTVAISCTILFIAFIQIVSLSVLIPLRLQMLTTVGADGAALQLVPLSLAVPFGAFIGGKLMTSTGRYKRIQIAGASIVPLAVLGLAFINPHTVVPGLVCMALIGLGIGLQLPTSTVAVQNAVEHRYVGIATAVSAFCRSLGAAIGIAVLMALLLATLQAKVPAAVASFSGADIIKAMMGDAQVHIDAMVKAQLAITVEGAFRKIFVISALIAFVSFILSLVIADETLEGKKPAS
ncbi:MDR family MFS transporter [Paralcaligenes ginsengisoli]